MLKKILLGDSLHPDAAHALIDVEIWSDRFEEALAVAQDAGAAYPGDASFLFKKITALASMGRTREAMEGLQKLLDQHPEHRAARNLYDTLYVASRRYTASIRSGAEFFDRVFDPSFYFTAQVGRGGPWGALNTRLNYARRFQADGYQAEVDVYPRIARGVMGYLTFGYSGRELFPAYRAGAELFFTLPHKLEVSAGATYMDFRSGRTIFIYMGSAAWYYRDYWFSSRLFVTPGGEGSPSVSAVASARRYLASADDFLDLSLGVGFSADLTRMQNSAALSEGDVHLLRSQRVALAWQKRFATAWAVKLALDVARQSLFFDPDEDVIVAGTEVTLTRKF